MAEQQERCETCRFWIRGEQVTRDSLTGNVKERKPAELGDCRRYAPRGPLIYPVNDVGAYADTQTFPMTAETAWCGEYQPTPVPARNEERET